MTRWKVLIEGDREDLIALLGKPMLRSANVVREDEEFFLDFPELHNLQGYDEVTKESTLRLAGLNEARTYVWGKGRDLAIKRVREVLPNGTSRASASLGFQVFLPGNPTIELPLPTGGIINLHEDQILTLLMFARSSNAQFAEALHYFHRSGDEWGDPYRTYELIKTSNRENFGHWISKTQQDRFTRSANCVEVSGRRSRHSVPKAEPRIVCLRRHGRCRT